MGRVITLTERSRDEIADILTVIARDGLDGPRDMDVAIDAILSVIEVMADKIAEIVI